MSEIFIKCMNQSIIVGWIIIFIILLRLLFKRMPKWIAPCLWIFVIIRFLIPSTFTNNFSIIPSAISFPVNNLYEHRIQVNTGIQLLDKLFNEHIFMNYYTGVSADYQATTNFFKVISLLWCIVMCVFLLVFVWHYISLRIKLKESIRISKNVYINDCITTSFVFGVIFPRVYLPTGLSEAEEKYILEHEIAHIKRKDYLIKIIFYFFLGINCFNPLVWLAYYLISKDIELACDEYVIKNKDEMERKEYAKILYSKSTGCSGILFNTSFSACFLKTRIKNINDYNSASAVYIGIIILGCVLFIIFTIGNPGQGDFFGSFRKFQ